MEWIKEINDKTNTPQEDAIWKILEENGVNPMLIPNCCEDILRISFTEEDGSCDIPKSSY